MIEDQEPDLSINPHDLLSEAAHQPSRYGYYAAKTTAAEAQFEEAKHVAEVYRANAYLRASKRDPKLTVGKLEATVVLLPGYVIKQRAMFQAKKVWQECRALSDSFRQRGDMIKSMLFCVGREEDQVEALRRNARKKFNTPERSDNGQAEMEQG